MEVRLGTVLWVTATLALLFLLVTLREVLTPFAIGVAVAYLLNPLVSALERYSLRRDVAVCLVLLGFFLLLTVGLILIVPALLEETRQLLNSAPEMLETARQQLLALTQRFSPELAVGQLSPELEELIRNNLGNALNVGRTVVGSIVSSGGALMDFITLLLITPLTAFFALLSWSSLLEQIDDLIPRDGRDETRELVAEIDRRVSGFVRGQLVVAACLGLIYAVSLSVAGLQFGFTIGLGAGVLSIIPLFGSVVGFVVGVLTAWYQAGELAFVAIVGAIFLAGQFIEGNFIAPQILGKSVGLHPLVILFAIMAGGSLAGVTGMLLAVPVASIIVVLGSHGLKKYKKSSLYDAT